MIDSTFAFPNAREWAAIFAMFAATYSTRLLGWLLLRNRTISPRAKRVLEAAPGCVMASIVAPVFMTTDPVMLAALAVTILVALKTNLAVTVAASVAAYAVIHQASLLLGG